MKNVKMTINVPEDLYKMIKVQSAVNGSTIKDYVVGTISNSMKNQKDEAEKKSKIAGNSKKRLQIKLRLKPLKTTNKADSLLIKVQRNYLPNWMK